MRTGTGSGTTGLKWLIDDHLGSTAITADGATGARLSELRYKPWGEIRYASQPTMTDRRYTGQRMEGTGLYDYGARWYDASLGRFLSADSIVPNMGDPQAWDRYAYVDNNPVVNVDPTGHVIVEGTGGGGVTDKESNNDNPSKKKTPLFSYNKKEGLCVSNLGCSGGSDYWDWETNENWPSIPQEIGAEMKNVSWMGGFNASASSPVNEIYYTGGQEGVLLPNGTGAIYSYGGEGKSIGVGASVTFYAGVVVNLHNPAEYTGEFSAVGFTASVGQYGVSASYFWNPQKGPLSSGNVQGASLGFAPGAQLSGWWSVTNYSLNWVSR
jgi:RHS repeat-associated protein